MNTAREIKFKFWLGHTKKMTYGHDLQGFCKIILEFTPDVIPLQYTGLKDKNSKEIYEGDILKHKDSFCYVIWDDAAFAIKSPGSEAVDWEHSSFYTSSEAIGNIYENPELLNPLQS